MVSKRHLLFANYIDKKEASTRERLERERGNNTKALDLLLK